MSWHSINTNGVKESEILKPRTWTQEDYTKVLFIDYMHENQLLLINVSLCAFINLYRAMKGE